MRREEIYSLNDLVLSFINGQDVCYMDSQNSGTLTALERTDAGVVAHIKADVVGRVPNDEILVAIKPHGNTHVTGFYIRHEIPRMNESRDI